MNACTVQVDNLIEDLHNFYVEVTGDGISPEFEQELRSGGVSRIEGLLNDVRYSFGEAMYKGDEMEGVTINNIRRDGSMVYVDPFEIQPQY